MIYGVFISSPFDDHDPDTLLNIANTGVKVGGLGGKVAWLYSVDEDGPEPFIVFWTGPTPTSNEIAAYLRNWPKYPIDESERPHWFDPNTGKGRCWNCGGLFHAVHGCCEHCGANAFPPNKRF